MITISVIDNKMQKLAEAVERSGRKMAGEVAAALNATAKKVKLEVNREIRTELAAQKKYVDRTITITKKATNVSSLAGVTVSKTERLPLKSFGAKQTGKGVSYRISKTEGRKTILGAFVSEKLGGHTFKRAGPKIKKGNRNRQRIYKRFGPNPYEVFVNKNMMPKIERIANRELRKQLTRRIKFNVLKASGTI